MSSIKVTLTGSPSGHHPKHRETLRALGLTRIGATRVLPDNAATRGMVKQVSYLVNWSEEAADFKPFGKRAARKA